MKLRFQAGNLRLRLSRSEIAELADAGKVENKVTFALGQELVYAIECADAPDVAATFQNGRILVTIPHAVAKHWIESDETGVEGQNLLIEKDFQCLHRAPEPGEDPFPNPLANG